MMLNAIRKDMETRIGQSAAGEHVHIAVAYTPGDGIEEWVKEVQEAFPDHEIIVNALSLSVACHIGTGALAIAVTKETEY